MSHDDRYSLETPENIELEFEVAGIGSRFCAIAFDSLLMGLIGFVLGLLIFSLVDPKLGPGGKVNDWFGSSPGWLVALLLTLLAALFMGGYYILSEWLMRGQTPGKRYMQIRVMRDDGTPVVISDVLVRNIVRIVDWLPAFYCFGLCVMFFERHHKRLGDLAAGTIVVKEGQADYRARADKRYKLGRVVATPANSELTSEERRFITGFLHRRDELLPAAREQLASKVARPLFEKYGGEFDSAESYLERLLEGRHHAA